jgi:hypothetical protein
VKISVVLATAGACDIPSCAAGVPFANNGALPFGNAPKNEMDRAYVHLVVARCKVDPVSGQRGVTLPPASTALAAR